MRSVFSRHGIKRVLPIGIGVLAAAGLFVGGAFAGAAIDSDDSDSVPRTIVLAESTPGPAGPAAYPAGLPAQDGDSAGYGVAREEAAADLATRSSYPYWGYCGDPEDIGGALSGSSFDPAQLGFEMTLLGAGFELESISFRSEALCDENGEPAGSVFVVDTQWRHTETGFRVWVTQRQSPDQVPNILEQNYAGFWQDGYAYNVSVDWFGGVMPLAIEKDAASGAELVPPDAQMDPRVGEVLREAIAALAPGLDEACFYRSVQGTWDDLAAMGVGDPRPALPAGFNEVYFDLRRYDQPAEGCDVAPLDEFQGVSFSATFSDGNGTIGVSAYGMPDDVVSWPGYMDQYSVNWTATGVQFSIYGDRAGQGIGQDTLRAIALAIDPGFSEACLQQTVELTEEDFANLGFSAPVPPEGYTLSGSGFTGQVVSPDCDQDLEYKGYYSANWSFTDAAGNGLDAGVYWSEGTVVTDGSVGYMGPGYLSWTDSEGVSYSVSSWSAGGGNPLEREALFAVALSMDPSFDPESLQEEGGWSPAPMPRPVDSAVEEPAEEPSE